MPVEGAGSENNVRRPVRHIEQPAINHVQRQLAVVVVGVQEQAQARVLFILGADGAPSLLPHRPQRGQQNAEQQRNDSDHHEKLNQCKSSFSVHGDTIT